MADTEKDVNRAAAAPQEEASAAQAAPEAPQPETQDAEKTEKKEKHTEGKAHAELAALKTKLEQAEKKLAETKDTLLRTAAEYENFRKRSARERDALFADVRSDTVVKFLPVYDNLLRAIAMTPEGDPGRKGIEMTLTQFETVLTKLGVTPIEALGQSFDPALHNAVMHTEDPEQGESVVVEEFEKGFKMGDKVIRFSMVKVAN